jgi:hypothetical protein
MVDVCVLEGVERGTGVVSGGAGGGASSGCCFRRYWGWGEGQVLFHEVLEVVRGLPEMKLVREF